MARPQKNTVDYFPHLIGSGKKMQYIETKYGNDGYASWFKILETLASTENHFLNLNKDIELMFLSAKCRVSVDILLSIINDLVLLEVINPTAWENRIIWSETFMESIKDAYKRRESKTHDFDSLCKHLSGLGIHINRNKPVNVDNNAGKESKGKRKGKENEKESKSESPELENSDAEKKLFNDSKKVFLDFYQTEFNKPYYFEAKDAAKLKNLLKKIEFQVRAKCSKTGEVFTTEMMPHAFEYFIIKSHQKSDTWIKDNFTLSILDSKFNEIFNQIQNGKSNKSNDDISPIERAANLYS